MNRSRRMEPVAKVAQGRERDAALALAERQRRLEEQERRLEELTAYRAEYARSFESTARGAGFSALRLRNYRAFLDQLDQAIVQQQGMVARARHDLEESRSHWAAVRSRAKAVDHMVERLRRQEHAAEERKEQRDTDERGQHCKKPL